MNWRDLLLGSILTLFVTVIGSIIAYYFTREAPPPPPAEKLVYEIDAPVSFDSGQTKVSFFNVRVKNVGAKSATNVTVGVEFDGKIRITDHLVSLSSGPVGNVDVQALSDGRLKARVAVLTPDEIVTIAILTNSAEKDTPRVGVKSDTSAGEHAPLNSSTTPPPARNDLLEIVIPIAFVFQIVAVFLMRERLARVIGRFMPQARDINNTAFVLLHSGLIEEAIELLTRANRDAGAEPMMLANLGLALGLQGDTPQSESVLKAAEFWAGRRSHEQAVIAFNRSLIAFERGEEEHGIELMQRAIRLSKTEILRYAAYSTIVSRLREENEKFRMFLDEHVS